MGSAGTLCYTGVPGKSAMLWGSIPYGKLHQYITTRKVAGSIPDGAIRFFHWHNPSDRTMALGSTQPLTEMSTRSISWG